MNEIYHVFIVGCLCASTLLIPNLTEYLEIPETAIPEWFQWLSFICGVVGIVLMIIGIMLTVLTW